MPLMEGGFVGFVAYEHGNCLPTRWGLMLGAYFGVGDEWEAVVRMNE